MDADVETVSSSLSSTTKSNFQRNWFRTTPEMDEIMVHCCALENIPSYVQIADNLTEANKALVKTLPRLVCGEAWSKIIIESGPSRWRPGKKVLRRLRDLPLRLEAGSCNLGKAILRDSAGTHRRKTIQSGSFKLCLELQYCMSTRHFERTHQGQLSVDA